MFELTIDGKVYPFNFGMGFMREINKTVKIPVEGLPEVKKNLGFRYAISGILDYDLEVLVDSLEIANKGLNPRIERTKLDAYIDDENTDIEKLFADVTDFLSNANVSKKIVAEMREAIAEEKAKAEAEAKAKAKS